MPLPDVVVGTSVNADHTAIVRISAATIPKTVHRGGVTTWIDDASCRRRSPRLDACAGLSDFVVLTKWTYLVQLGLGEDIRRAVAAHPDIDTRLDLVRPDWFDQVRPSR